MKIPGLGDEQRERTVSIVLIVLLAFSVTGAVAITVVEQTALDEDFVEETFEEERVQPEMTDGLQQNLAENIPETVVQSDAEAEELATEALTEEFVRTEIRTNIDDTYEYVRGDDDELNLSMDYESVRDSLIEQSGPEHSSAINDTIPRRVDIDEDPDESGLALARTVVPHLSTMFLACAGLIVGLLGTILYRTSTYRQVAAHTGVALGLSSVVATLVGVLLLIVSRTVTITPSGETFIDPTVLFDGVLAVLSQTATSLLIQAGVLLVFGVVLFGIGVTGDTETETETDSSEGTPESEG